MFNSLAFNPASFNPAAFRFDSFDVSPPPGPDTGLRFVRTTRKGRSFILCGSQIEVELFSASFAGEWSIEGRGVKRRGWRP